MPKICVYRSKSWTKTFTEIKINFTDKNKQLVDLNAMNRNQILIDVLPFLSLESCWNKLAILRVMLK